MNGYVYSLIDGVLVGLGIDGVFIVLCALPLISCVINIILSVCLSGFTLTKRLWYIAVAVFSVSCCCGFCSRIGCGYTLPFFVFAFCVLLFIPLATIKPKNCENKDAKELVEFIDKNIYGDGFDIEKEHEDNNTVSRENISKNIENKFIFNEKKDKDFSDEIDNINSVDKRTAKDFELDFEHVKNVISRLNYYELKDTDKRQVKELENALLRAERGEFNIDVKSRINDGLGALLKIMSKYGI